MSRKTNQKLAEVLGASASQRSDWQVMEGAVRTVTITLHPEGKSKKVLDSQSFRIGKNVRGELAKLGYSIRYRDSAEYQDLITRLQLAERVSHNRGEKFLHRSGYVVAFEGAKGAKIADAANEIAKNRNERVRARKVLASAEEEATA